MIEVSQEFLDENKANLIQFNTKSHKRGPYTPQQKEARRNEVYRLHFDYGYSARKISDLMKIDKNTIAGDVNYWYAKACKNMKYINPGEEIYTHLTRLEQQRTRLRELLDKTYHETVERLTIERLIFDLDCKIINVYHKLEFTERRYLSGMVKLLNKTAEENGLKQRWINPFEILEVPPEVTAKIRKTIREAENTPKGSRGV